MRKKNIGMVALCAVLIVLAAGTVGAAIMFGWLSLPGYLLGARDDQPVSTAGDGHEHSGDHGHSHGGHGHDHDDDHHGRHAHQEHEGHDEANALELSEVAWKNIGLKTGIVELSDYVRTVAVPAMVVERPGRSQVAVTAPLTGTVTRVYAIEGEAVQPRQPLFDLRLTHEDLVTAQRDFLKSTQELDVVRRELQRLQSVGEGVIAGRVVLEQQYEQQKIQAALHAQRQGLLLHGLTAEQVDQIQQTRELLQSLTVNVPPFDDDIEHGDVVHLYHVQKVAVTRGQHVVAGDRLGMLADHCLLYVEGQAFEDDARRLAQAAREGWLMAVTPVGSGQDSEDVEQLPIMYVADHIDADSRALHFYLLLANELVRDEREDEHRFVAWQYRPGQRMEVRIPLSEPWQNQVVLPAEAVVEEGAEAFVFQRNDDHFDRLPVHILYRDNKSVVVANDGSLVGTTLAMSGAYQMHLAIKNQAGSRVDPHAGHSH